MELGGDEGLLIRVRFILLPSGLGGWICLQKKPGCPTPARPPSLSSDQPDLSCPMPKLLPAVGTLPCGAPHWTPFPSLDMAGPCHPPASEQTGS